jgi:hypothetical protein
MRSSSTRRHGRCSLSGEKTGRKDPDPFVMHLHPAAIEIIRRQPILEESPFRVLGRRDKRLSISTMRWSTDCARA